MLLFGGIGVGVVALIAVVLVVVLGGKDEGNPAKQTQLTDKERDLLHQSVPKPPPTREEMILKACFSGRTLEEEELGVFKKYNTRHVIDLSGNHLFPDGKPLLIDLSTLARLDQSKVISLNLSNNHLVDISDFNSTGFSNLEVLSLTGNQLNDLKPLAGLKKLEKLNLDHNKITDSNLFSELTNLPKLAFLNLNTNQLTNIRGLEGLTNLTTLDLSDNKLTEIRGLEGLTNLTTLDLENNKLTDRQLTYLWTNALKRSTHKIQPRARNQPSMVWEAGKGTRRPSKPGDIYRVGFSSLRLSKNPLSNKAVNQLSHLYRNAQMVSPKTYNTYIGIEFDFKVVASVVEPSPVPAVPAVAAYKRPEFKSTQTGKNMDWGWSYKPVQQLVAKVKLDKVITKKVPNLQNFHNQPETAVLTVFGNPDFEYEHEYQGTKYPVYVYKNVSIVHLEKVPAKNSSTYNRVYATRITAEEFLRRTKGRYPARYTHVSFIMRTDNQDNRFVSRVLPGEYAGHLFHGPFAEHTVLEAAFRAKLKKPKPNVLIQEDLDRGIRDGLILGRLSKVRFNLEDKNIKFLGTLPGLTRVHFLVGAWNKDDAFNTSKGQDLAKWISEEDEKFIAKIRTLLPRRFKVVIHYHPRFIGGSGGSTNILKILKSAFPSCLYRESIVL
jgi:Leucine-rich repeat (LRR) protein